MSSTPEVHRGIGKMLRGEDPLAPRKTPPRGLPQKTHRSWRQSPPKISPSHPPRRSHFAQTRNLSPLLSLERLERVHRTGDLRRCELYGKTYLVRGIVKCLTNSNIAESTKDTQYLHPSTITPSAEIPTPT